MTPPVAALLAVVTVVAVVGVVDAFARAAHDVQVRAEVAADADALVRDVSDVVARESAAVETLSAFVDVTRGDATRLAGDFPVFAEALLDQAPNIVAVQLAPGSVLQYVYPLEGNEAALGLDLMSDADRRSLLVPAIASGHTVIQGPVALVQGGNGLIVRRPTYGMSGRFWGFSAVVLSWDRIIEQVGFGSDDDTMIGLRSVDSSRVLAGDAAAFDGESVRRTLRVGDTDTSWEIALLPADGWSAAAPITPILWIVGAILAAGGAALAYGSTLKPQVLGRERQRAIDELELAEARYQAAFEHADVGIVICGLAGTIVKANPAFRRILDLDESSPLARTIHSYIHPDHRGNHWRRFLELATTGDPVEHETLIVRGEVERWCRMRVATMPMEGDGESVFVVVIEDITDRRRSEVALAHSEAHHRTLFELAPVAIQRESYTDALRKMSELVDDPSRVREHLDTHRGDLAEILSRVRITDANPAASELQQHLEQTGDGLTLLDRLTDQAVPTYIDTLVAMADGRETLELEVTTAGADGEPMYMVVHWRVPRVAGELDHSAVLVSFADVTRVRRAEHRLQELITSKDRFLASVAHELRTPLTAVVGFTRELLENRDAYGPDEQQEFLGLIEHHGSEMAYVIEDLLVVARADITQVRVQAVRIDVVPVVEESIRTLPGLCIAVESPDGGVLAHADPGRVRQIVRNLGTNAVRHGGQDIRVVVCSRDGRALIDVSDDGPELRPLDAQRIFEPYERTEGMASNPSSIGLGLTVSKTLAQLQGGDLLLAREDGRNVFRLALPLAESLTFVAG